MQWLALASSSLLTSAQCPEVLGSLGYYISKQLEVDSLSLAIDIHFEEDLRVGHDDVSERAAD